MKIDGILPKCSRLGLREEINTAFKYCVMIHVEIVEDLNHTYVENFIGKESGDYYERDGKHLYSFTNLTAFTAFQ